MIDEKTITELQKLIPAVQYVANLPATDKEQKKACEEIVTWFENLNTSQAKEINWNLFLDILDQDIMYGCDNKRGYYNRAWHLSFEGGIFEATAKSIHSHLSDNGLDHHGSDYFFDAMVLFKSNQSYFSNDCASFIDDIKKYKSYISSTLNTIEIDVEVY